MEFCDPFIIASAMIGQGVSLKMTSVALGGK